MKLKEQLKCIIEQLVIIGVITLILLILGVIVKNIVSSVLNFLPESLYYTLYNILINGVYVLLCLVLGTSLVLHIFKIRYLDYYVIVKEKKEEVIEETITEETNVGQCYLCYRYWFSGLCPIYGLRRWHVCRGYGKVLLLRWHYHAYRSGHTACLLHQQEDAGKGTGG